MTKLRVAGSFSGVGGIELGFRQAGFEVVYANENDKFANQTYIANFGSEHLDTRSVWDVPMLDIPEHDVFVGGFPCQAFSPAGKGLGFEDPRGVLFRAVARILKYKQPPAFLLENVKGLVAHDGGRTFKIIRAALESSGYHLQYKVLNAAEYGVPQKRHRIYIVGFLDPTQAATFSFPKPSHQTTRVSDILEADPDESLTLSDVSWEKCHSRTERKMAGSGGQAYSIVQPSDAAAYTITNPRYLRNLVAQDGKNPRKMSGRECFNAQGFPADFVLPVSEAQLGKQAGNAVAVPVIRLIAQEIATVLSATAINRELVAA